MIIVSPTLATSAHQHQHGAGLAHDNTTPNADFPRASAPKQASSAHLTHAHMADAAEDGSSGGAHGAAARLAALEAKHA
jgi:hypothetical protein